MIDSVLEKLKLSESVKAASRNFKMLQTKDVKLPLGFLLVFLPTVLQNIEY